MNAKRFTQPVRDWFQARPLIQRKTLAFLERSSEILQAANKAIGSATQAFQYAVVTTMAAMTMIWLATVILSSPGAEVLIATFFARLCADGVTCDQRTLLAAFASSNIILAYLVILLMFTLKAMAQQQGQDQDEQRLDNIEAATEEIKDVVRRIRELL